MILSEQDGLAEDSKARSSLLCCLDSAASRWHFVDDSFRQGRNLQQSLLILDALDDAESDYAFGVRSRLGRV